MSIIVQRKHLVAPADRAEFERMSSQGVWETFLRFGSKMLAYGSWVFGGGRVDGVVTHQAYADFEHWQATRPRFAGAPGAFHTDEAIMAETEATRAISAGRRSLVTGSEPRVIEVNDDVREPGVFYRREGTPPADPPPTYGRGSVVSERTYALAGGAEPEFRRLSQEQLWPWLEQQGARLIAYGQDPLGPSDEVTTLFAFRSLTDWHRLSRPSADGARPEAARAWEQRAALIRSHHGRLLAIETDFGTAV